MRKQDAQSFDKQRFDLRKLNELEVREQYQIEITNRFAALENSDNDGDVNRTSENIKEKRTDTKKEIYYYYYYYHHHHHLSMPGIELQSSSA